MSHSRLPRSVVRLLPLLLFLILFVGAPVRAELTVLASIKPLGLIVEEVVGERGQVDTLLQGSASPHNYAMRVSDMQRLQAADVVVWVGPEMETFLVRSLKRVPAERLVEAQKLPGVGWPGNDAAPHGAHEGHFHQRDPHIWLNPHNGALIAEAVAKRLGELDPEGREYYRRNAVDLNERLQDLDRELRERMQPLSGLGFAVYHEGYRHFVDRYGLTQLGHVTFGPEQRPGARHLHRLRQSLAQAHCLFLEPYYDTGLAEELADDLGLQVGQLDPLGLGSSSYPQLLEAMGQSFLDCLAPKR